MINGSHPSIALELQLFTSFQQTDTTNSQLDFLGLVLSSTLERSLVCTYDGVGVQEG